MSKIKIISDSAGDIRYDLIEKLGIKVLPINLFFGETLIRDYADIKHDEFYDKLESADEIPTTSQISPTDFYNAYKEAYDEGFDTVLCFTLSKAASGTYNNANLAATMLKDDGMEMDIEIIDTMTYSFVYGRAVEVAAQMAKDGAEKTEILDKIYPMMTRSVALFAVDTLKYLKAGGRIKPSVAAIGDILDIKPILTVEDGLVESLEKVRGKKKVTAKLVELAETNKICDATEIWLLHAGNIEKAQELETALSEKLGVTITGISYIGPTIGINTGRNAYAVFFFKN